MVGQAKVERLSKSVHGRHSAGVQMENVTAAAGPATDDARERRRPESPA